MPVLIPTGAEARRADGFAAWRVVAWLLLLMSAFGCVQYLRHAHLVWQQAGALPPASPAAAAGLHGMLAWDLAYLVVALVFVVLSAGGILRKRWSRTPLRLAAAVLGIWVLVTTLVLLAEYARFDQASHDALLQVQGDPVLRQAMADARRGYHLGLAFKLVAAPVLLWFAWVLGRPRVRAEFGAHI